MEKIYKTICPKCGAKVEYKQSQVYEKMIVPKEGTKTNPFGYVKDIVDCPVCKYPIFHIP